MHIYCIIDTHYTISTLWFWGFWGSLAPHSNRSPNIPWSNPLHTSSAQCAAPASVVKNIDHGFFAFRCLPSWFAGMLLLPIDSLLYKGSVSQTNQSFFPTLPSWHKEICYDGLEESCWGNLGEVDKFHCLHKDKWRIPVIIYFHWISPKLTFWFPTKGRFPHKRWIYINMVDSSSLLLTLTWHLRDGLSRAT